MRTDDPRKAYVRKKLKARTLPGSELVLCGALVLLIWALGDFLTRLDAMDGLLKVEFNRIQQGKATLGETVGDIWSEPEARRDFLTLIVLAFSCLLGIFGIVTHRMRTGIATLVGGTIVLAYDPSRSLILKLVNYNTYVRLTACAILIVGSIIKIIYVLSAKRKYYAKYDKKHLPEVRERVPINSNGSSKTLIPVRQKENRK
jgi:hypothetical protein